MKKYENMLSLEKENKTGPGVDRTGDLEEHLRTVNALTTRPRCICCYGLKTWDHGYTRVAVWMSQSPVSWWGPGRHERANQEAP